MNRLGLFLFCQLLSLSFSFVVKWNKNVKEDKGDMRMRHDLVFVSSEKNINTTAFKNHHERFSNLSFEERCMTGKDLSVGFILYRPYVENIASAKYVVLTGIIPGLLKQLLEHCCPNSTVTYGELYDSIRQAEEDFDSKTDWDLTFPLYGLQGSATKEFKDNPFIPLVEAPRLVLLVPESLFNLKNTRTIVLLKTVMNAWPMLIFISVSACLSGLILWFLDRNKNPGEFPPSFFVGAWEGFWWAFVTMTTVGYGDRSPKSILARIFCIFWILCGIILISLFTGLVSAALSVSATPVFNVPGARIGAISGSKEFQIGVGLNADMKAFDHHHELFEALTGSKLEGAIIDNFILTAIKPQLEEHQLRIEREIPYPVMYGAAMRTNAPGVEKCFRKFIRHHPQKMFEKISERLVPVRNPTDDVRVEVKAAEKLFYEENSFKLVVYVQTGCLALFVIGGMIWEFFVRNTPTGKYGLFHATAHNREDKNEVFRLEPRSEQKSLTLTDVDMLINEYDSFHDNWISRLHSLRYELTHNGNGDIEPLQNNN